MKYLTLLLTLVFACGSAKEDKTKVLKDEVRSIHDEVMSKIGDLRRVRKELMLLADSLANTNSAEALIFTTAADDIANANEGMMNWMRNFEPEFEGTEEEVWQYFEDQKKSIQRVKKDMEESLTVGKGVLE